MATKESIRESVLGSLVKNSRKSFRAVAKELGISTTTVSRAVDEMEKERIIRGYSVDVNWERLGYRANMCMHIGLERGADAEVVGASIKRIPGVKQVLQTSDELPLAVFAACRDRQDAEITLGSIRNIPGVSRLVHHSVYRIF